MTTASLSAESPCPLKVWKLQIQVCAMHTRWQPRCYEKFISRCYRTERYDMDLLVNRTIHSRIEFLETTRSRLSVFHKRLQCVCNGIACRKFAEFDESDEVARSQLRELDVHITGHQIDDIWNLPLLLLGIADRHDRVNPPYFWLCHAM